MHLKKKNYHLEAVPEAYSRVTNPERFRSLHGLALELVARFRSKYDVIESDTLELIPDIMRPIEHARPPITLTPTASGAAPIAIAFTLFPSLIVRCGRLFNTPFPVCACDGCAATAEREGARLEEILTDVVAGHFREELQIPLFGDARVRWSLGIVTAGDGHLAKGASRLSRERARALRATGFRRVQWMPWPQR